MSATHVEVLIILWGMLMFIVLMLIISKQPPRESSSIHDHEFEQARRRTLSMIAQGSKKSVYAIPESFGRHVLKVGPLLDIHQETRVIEQLTKSHRGLLPGVRGQPKPRKFRLPLIPEIKGSKAPWSLRESNNHYERSGREIWDAMHSRVPKEEDNGNIEDETKDSMDIDREYDESKATNGQSAMIVRRIGGIQDPHRTRVLNQFYQHESKANVMASRNNDNLLVRVYLGETSPWYPLPKDEWKDELVADEDDLYDENVPLLDFPGHVDLLSRYCSSTPAYIHSFAGQMGHGYAVLHWGARFDGRGIEFLLGLNAQSNIRLHMLDFEECQPFVCWTRECVVKQLVPAALENERYLPRPSLAPDLWRAFKNAYLNLSHVILKANAGFGVWEEEKSGEWDSRRNSLYDDWDEEAAVRFLSRVNGDREDAYYGDADERVYKLPAFFIREFEIGLNKQDSGENASGVLSTVANGEAGRGHNGGYKRRKSVSIEEPFPKRARPAPTIPNSPLIMRWY